MPKVWLVLVPIPRMSGKTKRAESKYLTFSQARCEMQRLCKRGLPARIVEKKKDMDPDHRAEVDRIKARRIALEERKERMMAQMKLRGL